MSLIYLAYPLMESL
ncbi:hypothetical protein Ahy_B09g099023 isoform D [Arachis hypogaea]|uniref:Uncharacterized protein n=1 Tax=Arachis hypogaea TaxID=3818 RepID=A0A444XTI2_ARAHY|nr:hypothetical protein Ahy_B09g099023 isoform D [Arachis hypogaea]